VERSFSTTVQIFSLTDAVSSLFEMQPAEMLLLEMSSCVKGSFCFCLSSFFSLDSCLFWLASIHGCNELFRKFIGGSKILFSYDNFFKNSKNCVNQETSYKCNILNRNFFRNYYLKRVARGWIVKIFSELILIV